MTRTGPPGLIDERDFIPATLKEVVALKRALILAGTSYRVAGAVVAWLVDLPEHRAEDPYSDSARRDFRRELLRLGSPPWEGDPNRDMVGYVSSHARRRRNRRGPVGPALRGPQLRSLAS